MSYFVIHKHAGKFGYVTFPDETEWVDIVSNVPTPIIELFQSKLLEIYDFIQYFEENYRKNEGKTR